MSLKKAKYRYNTATHAYELIETTIGHKVAKFLGVISVWLVTIAATVWIVYRFVPSPAEQRMKKQQAYLQEQFDILQKNIKQHQAALQILQQRDEQVYRTIFEAEPISNSKLTNTENTSKLQPFSNTELISNMNKDLEMIQTKIAYQEKSYDELQKIILNKQEMLASIPSIQPISNNNLERIASGFGVRIDPIYKVPRLHTGLDFTAPQGTPIYATGNGIVKEINYAASGYGNYVIIEHGFGYQTLYGHMLAVKIGNHALVKRGQVIGYVGNTGKSTGPHCHYEVMRNNDKIDPIHFFYNDIKPQEYEQMTKLANAGNQSMN
jgi:murein DD-endopeptidase MepM/ murein hydrolase activator NlpD